MPEDIVVKKVISDEEVATFLGALRKQVEEEPNKRRRKTLTRNYRLLSYMVATGKRVTEVAPYVDVSFRTVDKIVKTQFGKSVCFHDLRKGYYLRLKKLNIEDDVIDLLLGHKAKFP